MKNFIANFLPLVAFAVFLALLVQYYAVVADSGACYSIQGSALRSQCLAEVRK